MGLLEDPERNLMEPAVYQVNSFDGSRLVQSKTRGQNRLPKWGVEKRASMIRIGLLQKAPVCMGLTTLEGLWDLDEGFGDLRFGL